MVVKMHDDDYEDCSLHWRVSCMNMITQEDDLQLCQKKITYCNYDLIDFFTNKHYMSADSSALQAHERG